MPQSQFAAPLIVHDGRTTPLQRVAFGDRQYNEDWLQRLLFEHPRLLPIGEIEPWFDDAMPVVRELPTRAGPLDLLYVNARGYLTLVETKLWRNPQARREVVGQVIDYAKEIARWSYGDLVDAVRMADPRRFEGGDDPLLRLAREASPDFDERDFVDSVQRGLRRGQFLLLIVGDGIREEVVQITDYLQSTPSLGYTLGLVEIALFRTGDAADDADAPLYVQPRTLAMTEVLTRAIVEIKVPAKAEDVVVTLPSEAPTTARGLRRPITEEEFLTRLGESASAEVVEFVRWALAAAVDARPGIVVRWGEGGPMIKYNDDVTGKAFTLCGFGTSGVLTNTERFRHRCEEFGLPDALWTRHLEGLAGMFRGGGVKTYHGGNGDPWSYVVVDEKKPPPLDELVSRREAWLEVITRTVDGIREATEGL